MPSYSESHEPSWAYLDADLGPVWTVVWVFPEKTTPSGPLTRRCPHRHRDHARAVACAQTRCADVRD